MLEIGQSRAYIKIESYIRAARPMLDAMGISTIMLFTDSGSAIDEAMNCTRDHPDGCGGLKFRYVEKKRWYGAEGGWENHLPSGIPQLELYYVQLEFALAQKCSMAIKGMSSYGDKMEAHMCCGFPLHSMGSLPQRCICPPTVQVNQLGFGSCEAGNLILCRNMSISAADFTKNNIAKEPSQILLHNSERYVSYTPKNSKEEVANMIQNYVKDTMVLLCKKYDKGPHLYKFCKQKQ